MLGCCSGWVLCKNRCLADRICIFAKKASHSPPISYRHLWSAFAFCFCPASLPCISCLLPAVRNIHRSSYCRNGRTLGLSLLHPYFLFFLSFLGFLFPFSILQTFNKRVWSSHQLCVCSRVFCTVPKPLLGAGCLSNWENQGWPSGGVVKKKSPREIPRSPLLAYLSIVPVVASLLTYHQNESPPRAWLWARPIQPILPLRRSPAAYYDNGHQHLYVHPFAHFSHSCSFTLPGAVSCRSTAWMHRY